MVANSANAVFNVLRIHVQSIGDDVGVIVEIAGRVAHQQRAEGGVVIDNDPAFAVEDLAPRREDRDIAYPVLFCQRGVEIVPRDLQPPEP